MGGKSQASGIVPCLPWVGCVAAQDQAGPWSGQQNSESSGKLVGQCTQAGSLGARLGCRRNITNFGVFRGVLVERGWGFGTVRHATVNQSNKTFSRRVSGWQLEAWLVRFPPAEPEAGSPREQVYIIESTRNNCMRGNCRHVALTLSTILRMWTRVFLVWNVADPVWRRPPLRSHTQQ